MAIKTGSDFSGVGAFDQALSRLGIKQDKYFACDMDKYARQTYVLNYGEPKYYPSDVYDREIPSDSLDIYMTSPPCQSFSLAGKRQGENSDKGVLFYNSHEFIKKNKPRYFIFENVKGLLSDDGGKTFQRWIDYLGGKSANGNPVIFPHEESVPYHVYYQVMNAKHYGVPQNRERIFIIGIRDDADNEFSFPKPFHLIKRLKDVLENEVDEKYFLSDKMIAGLTNKNSQDNGFTFNPKQGESIGNCVTARCFKMGADDNYIETLVSKEVRTEESKVFSENGEAPNICAGTHGYANGYVESKIGTWRTHEDGRGFRATEDNNYPTIPARAREDGSGQPVIKIGAIRGRNPQNPLSRVSGLPTEQMLEINESGTSNALTTVQKDNVVVIPANNSKGYDIAEEEEDSINFSNPNSETRRGRVGHGVAQTLDTACNQGVLVKQEIEMQKTQYGKHQQDCFYDSNGIIGTIPAGTHGNTAYFTQTLLPCRQRIRRLTPKECFALMDFNEDFKWDVSDSQAYKQAGNSIVVNCLVEIISKLNL